MTKVIELFFCSGIPGTKNNLLKNIQVRKGEWGEAYRVRFYFKKQLYTATFDTLTEAVDWRDRSVATLRGGGILEGDTPLGDMTLEEASDKLIKAAGEVGRQ